MKGFNYLVDSKVTHISTLYAKDNHITIEIAMEKFFDSNTYQILIDPETGLYLEVVDFVYDMFLDEVNENVSN